MNQEQNFANHRRMDPSYHYVLTALVLAILIGSVLYLVREIRGDGHVLDAFLGLGMAAAFTVIFILLRTYPLKAQDRAIRAEEQLRHYVLTQRLLDPRLDVKQITALRFASDAELPELAKKAAETNMAPDDIKKAIRRWRSDTYRV